MGCKTNKVHKNKGYVSEMVNRLEQYNNNDLKLSKPNILVLPKNIATNNPQPEQSAVLEAQRRGLMFVELTIQMVLFYSWCMSNKICVHSGRVNSWH